MHETCDFVPKKEDNWEHRSTNMKCVKCMYFVPKKQTRPMAVGEVWIGRCRRNAPTMSGWPAVYETDWCGNHKIDENK